MQLLKFLPFAALVSMVSACLNVSVPPTPSSATSDNAVTVDTILLEGELGEGYTIYMILNVAEDNSVIGSYAYRDAINGTFFYLKGTMADGPFLLAEFAITGEQTGTFNVSYEDGIMRGRYESKYDSTDFVLTTDRDPYGFFYRDFSIIDFDKLEIVSTDYAIDRWELNRQMNDISSNKYLPEDKRWHDYSEDFERMTKNFEEYVNNFDNNDATIMNGLGIEMVEYLDSLSFYFTESENYMDRPSVRFRKTFERFKEALDTLKQKLQ